MMSNLHFLIKSLRHPVQRSTVMEFKYSEQVTPAYFSAVRLFLLARESEKRRMCYERRYWSTLQIH